MHNINSVLIEGTLINDPQKQISDTGEILCLFDIESKQVGYGGTVRVPVIARNKTAEICLETLFKGIIVRVVGRIGNNLINSHAIMTHAESVKQMGKPHREPVGNRAPF